VSVADDLLHDYQHIIAELKFVTGAKGIFDVVVDGEVLFSKYEVGRHANDGEVLELFRDRYAQGVEVYER
jgi:predicted Rdx family selenoprotein